MLFLGFGTGLVGTTLGLCTHGHGEGGGGCLDPIWLVVYLRSVPEVPLLRIRGVFQKTGSWVQVGSRSSWLGLKDAALDKIRVARRWQLRRKKEACSSRRSGAVPRLLLEGAKCDKFWTHAGSPFANQQQ